MCRRFDRHRSLGAGWRKAEGSAVRTERASGCGLTASLPLREATRQAAEPSKPRCPTSSFADLVLHSNTKFSCEDTGCSCRKRVPCSDTSASGAGGLKYVTAGLPRQRLLRQRTQCSVRVKPLSDERLKSAAPLIHEAACSRIACRCGCERRPLRASPECRTLAHLLVARRAPSGACRSQKRGDTVATEPKRVGGSRKGKRFQQRATKTSWLHDGNDCGARMRSWQGEEHARRSPSP
jgi:hypothetical protein